MKNVSKIFVYAIMLVSMSLVILAAPKLADIADTADEYISVNPMQILSNSITQDGTEEYAYLIASIDDFNKYANLINNGNTAYSTAHYKLFCNINCYGRTIVPFGKLVTNGNEDYDNGSRSFKGVFDGNGYAILNVKIPDTFCSGVIGYMTKGTVKNLRVEYSDMPSRSNYSTIKFFGGILGRGKVVSGGKINITGCQTSGTIMINSAGPIYAGGLAGAVDSTLSNTFFGDCFTDMSFDVPSAKNSYLAGFAAHLKSGSTGKDAVLKNCISFGDVFLVSEYYEATAGSFAAYVQKDLSNSSGWASEDEAFLAEENVKHFENCVALGDVSASSMTKAKAGVFYATQAGEGNQVIANCYSSNEQTVNAVSKTPQTTSHTGTKLAVENFRGATFYETNLGIDFVNKWYFTNMGRLGLRTTAKSYGAAVIDNNRDIRLTSRPGIRFRSEIEMEKRDYAFEYGIVVASKAKLGDEELTLDFDGKVVGVAYAEDIDKFISKGDYSLVFSAVVINIKEENYASEIVARTYMKYVSEGETVVTYGEPVTTSLSDSAFSVRFSTNYEYLTDEQKALLETMLPKV